MGHGEGVVTGSPLGKAKFTVQEKRKKIHAALFVSLRVSFCGRSGEVAP